MQQFYRIVLQEQHLFAKILRMAKQNPIGIGVAGCGNVLSAYLPQIEELSRRGMAHLVAVCGTGRNRQQVSGMVSAPFFTDYGRFLEEAGLEVVLIITPMGHHAPMATAALQAGKHVVVEKPMATDLKQARDLVTLAEGRKLHLVAAPFTTLSPTFREIGRRIVRGDIGRPIAARGRYGWAGPDWSEWFYKAGGGAIFDLGVYNLTTLTGWLGPVRQVMAMTGTAIAQRTIDGRTIDVEVEDNAQVLLDFGNQCFASLFCGFTIQQYRGPGLEIYGTEGTIHLLGDDWDPDGFEIWRNSAGCWQLFKETHPLWPWTDGLRHLVEAMRAGTVPEINPRHALHVLEVMLQIQASGRERRVMPVESTFKPPAFDTEATEPAAHRVHDRTREE